MDSAQKQSQFEALQSAITKQREPATPVQLEACQEIVHRTWALRVELDRAKDAAEQEAQDGASAGVSEPPTPLRPYQLGREQRRQARRLLMQVRQEAQEKGAFRLERGKDDLTATFGPKFYAALAEWIPTHLFAIRMAELLIWKAERFNSPISEKMFGPHVVRDPNQGLEMGLRLIEEKLQHLDDLDAYDRQRGNSRGQGRAAVDPVAKAARELKRAVKTFEYLKRHGL
jgi:hypothetical protein